MEVYLYSCCTKVGAGWSGWSSSRPGKQTRYPSYGKLSGHQGRSRRVRKISPSPGFDYRTVQFVACRYTAYAMPAYSVSAAADINLKNMNIMVSGLHRLATKKWYVRNTQDTNSCCCVQNMFSYTSIYDMLSQQLACLLCQNPRRGFRMFVNHMRWFQQACCIVAGSSFLIMLVRHSS